MDRLSVRALGTRNQYRSSNLSASCVGLMSLLFITHIVVPPRRFVSLLYPPSLQWLYYSLGLFIDGTLSDSVNWQYPKQEGAKAGVMVVGDNDPSASMSWCTTSSYLVASPLSELLFGFSASVLTFDLQVTRSPGLFNTSARGTLAASKPMTS